MWNYECGNPWLPQRRNSSIGVRSVVEVGGTYNTFVHSAYCCCCIFWVFFYSPTFLMKLTHFYSCCKYVASLSDFSNSSFLQPTEAAKRMQQVVVICFYFSSFISYRSITVVRVCFAKISTATTTKSKWQAKLECCTSSSSTTWLHTKAAISLGMRNTPPKHCASLLLTSPQPFAVSQFLYQSVLFFFFFVAFVFLVFFFVPSACSLLFSQISANLFALSLCCFADFFRPFFPVLPALAIAAANTLHCKQIYVLLLLLLLLLCK